VTSKEKKDRLKAWKMAEKAKARNALPGPVDEMRGLFDYLSGMVGLQTCDKTRRITEEYIRTHGLATEAYLAWLDQHGGFCDCEVLNNCEQRLDDAL
jgi:hypothetical protein